MQPSLAFPNNWTAARAVRQYAEVSCADAPPLTLVPFGFHDPDFAPWWLVPGPKPTLPAYRHGKLCFYRLKRGTGAGRCLVGYYVEKGFPQAVGKALDLRQVEVMDDGWCWHRVVTAGRDHELDVAVGRVGERTGLAVTVDVSVGEVNAPPREDTEVRHGDRVSFKAGDTVGGLRLEDAGTSVLAPLNECTSIGELAAALGGSLDLRFYWVNLHIGVRLPYGAAGEEGWDAAEVWRRAMAPWLPMAAVNPSTWCKQPRLPVTSGPPPRPLGPDVPQAYDPESQRLDHFLRNRHPAGSNPMHPRS